MNVDTEGELEELISVCSSDQDELADDEKASTDDSSSTPPAEAASKKGRGSAPIILAEKKAAVIAKLQKELKKLVKMKPASTSHTLKILPYRFDLITTRSFKHAHIEDSEPKIEHFLVPLKEPEATTSTKMKSSKGKKYVKNSAAMSSSKLAAADVFLATITAEHNELQMQLSAMMSQFDLLLQSSQKMAEDNCNFFGQK
ncbi:uncharacterized protein LAESUDRAFT_717305 [Laetiporus sulphureus 93-53]|uniref:Uncharacterized protein n=1 Tax=Laetiporus sulphureus 93-53 TaxID=1314785 RepID=A0A165BV63_9APHY|nr:uncharacterized protein LAESUDRAFT_717305 [Laetiporus sulphureus 93-53]KZT01713.1 hypothetical protein LAESUDRAFT_717305 [Laetiporus sulphureus 93-53]